MPVAPGAAADDDDVRDLAKKPPNNLTRDASEGLARWKPAAQQQSVARAAISLIRPDKSQPRTGHSYAGAKGLMLGNKYDSYYYSVRHFECLSAHFISHAPCFSASFWTSHPGL